MKHRALHRDRQAKSDGVATIVARKSKLQRHRAGPSRALHGSIAPLRRARSCLRAGPSGGLQTTFQRMRLHSACLRDIAQKAQLPRLARTLALPEPLGPSAADTGPSVKPALRKHRYPAIAHRVIMLPARPVHPPTESLAAARSAFKPVPPPCPSARSGLQARDDDGARMTGLDDQPGLSRTGASLCVGVGAALIGLAPIGLRLAQSEIDPQATAFWRFLFAIPALLIIAAIVRAPIRKPGMLAAAGVAFGAEIGVWHVALTLTTVANATLFSNMTPIIAVLAGWLLFKERIRGGFAIGACIALFGAALLSLGKSDQGQAALIGDLLGLLSAVGYATYLIILSRARRTVHVVPAMLVTTCFAMLVSLIASVALGERILPQSASIWALLIGLGLVVHVGGQGLIAMGIGALPIALSTVLLWIQPVAAAAFAWVLFGENLGPVALIGAALIVVGITIVQKLRAT